VRELENAMKSAVVLADATIETAHLPPALRGGRASPVGRPRADARTAPAAASASALVPGAPAAASPPPASSRSAPAGGPAVLRVELEIPLDETGTDLKAVGTRAAEEAERALLRHLLAGGARSLARLSRLLDVDPKTLRSRLRKYGLDPSRPGL
jgi:DNA-binding NtrC family response regulator